MTATSDVARKPDISQQWRNDADDPYAKSAGPWVC